MKRIRHSPDQIVRKLREAEALLADGQPIAVVLQRLGVSEQSYKRWRLEYGGTRPNHVKRLKELEDENRRLKRAVADLTLDKQILEEAVRGKD